MKRKEIEVLARGVCVTQGHLLVCRTRGADHTYLPGGHVEFLEPVSVALAREIKEELGCKAHVGRFLGGVEHTFMQKGERHCELNLVFAMKVDGVAPRRDPPSMEDYIQFEWIPVRTLRRSDLEPAPLRQALGAWIRQKAGAGWLSTLE
jgi:8-oxo-dGTP diphosphatase